MIQQLFRREKLVDECVRHTGSRSGILSPSTAFVASHCSVLVSQQQLGTAATGLRDMILPGFPRSLFACTARDRQSYRIFETMHGSGSRKAGVDPHKPCHEFGPEREDAPTGPEATLVVLLLADHTVGAKTAERRYYSSCV